MYFFCIKAQVSIAVLPRDVVNDEALSFLFICTRSGFLLPQCEQFTLLPYSNSQKAQKREENTPLPFNSLTRKLHTSHQLYLFGKKLVTWSCITAKEAGKCWLYCGQPFSQLKIQDFITLRKKAKNRYWKAVSITNCIWYHLLSNLGMLSSVWNSLWPSPLL